MLVDKLVCIEKEKVWLESKINKLVGCLVNNIKDLSDLTLALAGGNDDLLCKDGILDVEDCIEEPNEWFFDDDPYGIVYYEFPDEDD